MNIYLSVLMICFILTYVYDVSGFITDISRIVYKKMNPDKPWLGQMLKKPVGCLKCMVFHCVWIFLIFNHVNILVCLSTAVLSVYISTIFSIFLKKIINYLNDKSK